MERAFTACPRSVIGLLKAATAKISSSVYCGSLTLKRLQHGTLPLIVHAQRVLSGSDAEIAASGTGKQKRPQTTREIVCRNCSSVYTIPLAEL
nr:hypothetical protein [Treponema vincentii]